MIRSSQFPFAGSCARQPEPSAGTRVSKSRAYRQRMAGNVARDATRDEMSERSASPGARSPSHASHFHLWAVHGRVWFVVHSPIYRSGTRHMALRQAARDPSQQGSSEALYRPDPWRHMQNFAQKSFHLTEITSDLKKNWCVLAWMGDVDVVLLFFVD